VNKKRNYCPEKCPEKCSGFSLLELIIVLVIIGIMAAAITLYIGNDREDKLKLETQRLAARISLAQDEAVLTNQEFGLEILSTKYRFLVLGDAGWAALDPIQERQLVATSLPETMSMEIREEGVFALFESQKVKNKYFSVQDQELATDEEGKTKEIVRPQVFLMSSGELNPFQIFIGFDDQEPVFYKVQASYDGVVSIDGPFYDSLRLAYGRTEQ